MIHIVFDMREDALIAEMQQREPLAEGITWSKTALPIGDIWITKNNEGNLNSAILILERKTLNDLAMSNRDNRYREQRARLLSSVTPDRRIGYVIEGRWTGNDSQTYGHGSSTEKVLRHILWRLQFKYSVPVFQTRSVAETLDLVLGFCSPLLKEATYFKEERLLDNLDKTAHVASAAVAEVNLSAVKRENWTPEANAVAALTTVPGCSLATAQKIMEQVNTIAGLSLLSEKDIAALSIGTRKVGPILAKRIVSVFGPQN